MACYSPQANVTSAVTVKVSSAVFSVINFFIFDIVLVSLVFWLTSDITGLFNAASALQQLNNRIQPYNPPLVGVGLTCTRRDVFLTMAAVRLISLTAVFATNFIIEGVSCERVRHVVQDVVVQADRFASFPLETAKDYVLRRRTCVGNKKSYVYYGELRLGGICELREELMSTPTVKFYFQFDVFNRTIVFPEGGCEFYTDNGNHRHMHRYTCRGLGTVGCEIRALDETTIPSSCVGVVMADDIRKGKTGRVPYMCEGEALFPGRFGLKRNSSQARCILAENANTTNPFWVPHINNRVRTLRDAVDLMYGMQVDEMKVKVTDPDDQIEHTQLERSWFLILAGKIILITVLVGVDMWLRARGLVPTANSESTLASLLAQTTVRRTLIGEDDEPRFSPSQKFIPIPLIVQKADGIVTVH